jgi:hypothetical protein
VQEVIELGKCAVPSCVDVWVFNSSGPNGNAEKIKYNTIKTIYSRNIINKTNNSQESTYVRKGK